MPLTFSFGAENDPKLLEKRPKTPVTLLAGFLGAGKTTLLKHLLENQHGHRIAVVVNDLASVNIDAQLLRSQTGQVAELQNGCVCCSSADDFFSAVQTLVMRSKDHPFEHILVELSGVGDPQAIRRNWAWATECQVPAALLTNLARVVTVVDASTFAEDLADIRKASQRNEEPIHDTRPQSFTSQMVGQLLAEQVEVADVLILNKCDLVDANALIRTLHVLQALNGNAQICQTQFGRVSASLLLPPVPLGLKIQSEGHEDGFSWTQTAEEIQIRMPIATHVTAKDVVCLVKKKSLRLGLQTRDVAAGSLAGVVANCDQTFFEIEGEGADRRVLVCLEKKEPGMWNQLWKQSAPTCGHQKCNGQCLEEMSRKVDEVKPRFQSFVFQRRTPFSSKRLQRLLEHWQDALSSNCEVLDMSCCALKAVLRSKGFAWCDGAPLRRHRWSSAGRCVGCAPEEFWWWPLSDEQKRFRRGEPGAEAEFQELQKKWDAEWGDCRQELVFIGTQLDEPAIVQVLEDCLLTASEFQDFRDRTSGMQVPPTEFSVEQLFGKLTESKAQVKDDHDTEFLRSLGVGCSLRAWSRSEADGFEAVD